MLKEDSSRLIKNALNGDQKAYEALLKRYQHGVYNIIFQMVKNREETEDLVQETFMKAFNALESYNDHYAFSTWLYKIAYNNCIDSIRKKKLKIMPLDKPIKTHEGEMHQQISDDSSSPENDFLFNEKKQMINNLIEDLPPVYREVIILRHRKERSYEEICDILKIPLGTVKARMFRAREMLKSALLKKE
jgi:RNA polymerase sigma-70 factor (ECF subfamily)